MQKSLVKWAGSLLICGTKDHGARLSRTTKASVCFYTVRPEGVWRVPSGQTALRRVSLATNQ